MQEEPEGSTCLGFDLIDMTFAGGREDLERDSPKSAGLAWTQVQNVSTAGGQGLPGSYYSQVEGDSTRSSARPSLQAACQPAGCYPG